MKQVIKGITYNTDTATLIEQWNNVGEDGVLSIRDMGFKGTALYRRKDGKYFFRNEGGDCPAWGTIAPVSVDRARSFCESMEWTEEKLVEEYDSLIAYARKNGLSEQEVLEKAIDTFLNK